HHFDSQQFYRTVNLICKNSIISIFKQLQILFAVVQLLADSDPVSIFQLAPEQNRHNVKHLSYISVTIADSLHSDSFKSIVQKMRINLTLQRLKLGIFLFDLSQIAFLDIGIQFPAHFIEVFRDHVQLISIYPNSKAYME